MSFTMPTQIVTSYMDGISASAKLPRTDFKAGIKSLLFDRNAVLCALAYGLSGGTFLAWQVTL